eukprot:8212664-Karenia_brevis.AAC.1
MHTHGMHVRRLGFSLTPKICLDGGMLVLAIELAGKTYSRLLLEILGYAARVAYGVCCRGRPNRTRVMMALSLTMVLMLWWNRLSRSMA